jgi:peptidoglycan L-alanyl-D-glutamate endopeptidase CwlK
MPRFSRLSRKRLETCDHHLQILFNEIIKHIDCAVDCGHRTKAAQNAAYKKGLTKLCWPHSLHNRTPSDAIDVVPLVNGQRNYEANNCRLFAGKVLGFAAAMNMDKRIRCGVDWNGDGDTGNQVFHDICHFEVIPLPK